MPINDQYKIMFIHIPKAGGTSIEHFFNMTENENLAFYRWDRDQEAFLKKYRSMCINEKLTYEPQHYPLEVLKDIVPDYHDYFSFSFTRHPYTKLLSEYYWLSNQRLNAVTDFNPQKFHSWCTTFLAALDSSHKEPQVNYIDSSVHFVGKFENLNADFELLKSKLIAFSPALRDFVNKPLPHENSTGIDKQQLISYMLPQTKQLIYEQYQSDFETFAYDPALLVYY